MIELTKEEKHILLHTLGYDYSNKTFRNRYVASSCNSNWEQLQLLVKKGLMEQDKVPLSSFNEYVFWATKEGEKLAKGIAKEERKKGI